VSAFVPKALSVLIAGFACAGEAVAQEQTQAGVSYPNEYFAPFSPRTALDMVERVPGFTIDEGEERRGFAGAQGNVLIDGQAPTSKAQDIDDILARIPSRDVIRIELVRGAAAGNAQSLYVNVVRRAGGGEGVWSLGLARADDGELSPEGELAYSARRGDVEYGLSAAYDSAHAPVSGERTDYDSAGAFDGRRVERLPIDEREGRIAGEATFPLADWRAAINFQLSRSESDEVLSSSVFDATGVPDELIAGDVAEREIVGEIGAAFRREDGPWRSEFAVIATRSRFDADEASVERDGAGAFSEAADYQTQRVERGETIVRAAFERALAHDWRLSLGAEAAYNMLEQRIALLEDAGAGPVPVPLPSANVLVEEERGEISFMLAGPLTPRWRFEGGASAEASMLRQEGDTNAETELAFLKPTLQLTRSIGARNQLRLRLYRDVGQLDFEDFVSAADIQNAVVNAGNPDLRPETSWRWEAEGDWRFGDDGALSLQLYRWAIDDAIDLVPVGAPGALFDAPGNIGEASLTGVRAQLALPLPADAELRIDSTFQRTEATDPLTGETRAISETEQRVLRVNFRQDIGAFAWGVDYEQEVEAPAYRIDRDRA
jgi:hypothetical protein